MVKLENKIDYEAPVYFDNLDAIRFFAAMMVFLSHSIKLWLLFVDFGNDSIQKWMKVIMNGETGVSIFFVLSGFLITYLIMTEQQKKGSLNLKNFYLRRLLRIWPLYYATLFLTFFIYPALKIGMGLTYSLDTNVWYHLAFLSNFDAMHVYQSLNHHIELSQIISWSVSIEEQFYLFWPLIFLLPRKIWSYLIVAIILLSLLFRMSQAENEFVLYYHTFSVIGDLAMGGIFAFFIYRFSRFRGWFESSGTWFHVLLFSLIVGLLYANESIVANEIWRPFYRLFTSFLFAVFIAAQAFSRQSGIHQLGKLKFATKWGKLTYGIYLLHQVAILTVHLLLSKVLHFRYETSSWSIFVFGLLCLMTTLLFSSLSYKYLERPFLRIKDRLSVLDKAPKTIA